jgi:hypothetical protein
MKRVIPGVLSMVIGLVLMATSLLVGPGVSSAAPVSRDQAVNLVVTRGLAQRGVP